jgi:hypothetical protein
MHLNPMLFLFKQFSYPMNPRNPWQDKAVAMQTDATNDMVVQFVKNEQG